MEPFMRKRPHDRPDGLSTNCTGRPQGGRSGLFVAPGRMASGSVHSEKALTGQEQGENDLLIVNAEVVTWKDMQPVKGVWHDGPDGEKAADEQGV